MLQDAPGTLLAEPSGRCVHTPALAWFAALGAWLSGSASACQGPEGKEDAAPQAGAWQVEARAVLPGGAQFLQPASLSGGGPQWLQGISATVELGPDRFLCLLDNGNGALENSRECLLALVEVRVEGPRLHAERPVFLTDPEGHLPFALVRGGEPERYLTGADLDPESLVRLADGTLWIGDEFGPFLLHFDGQGRLLQAPIELGLLPEPTGAVQGSGGAAVARHLERDSPGDLGPKIGAPAPLWLRSPQHPAQGPSSLLRWLSRLDLLARETGGGPVRLSPAKDLLLEAGAGFDRLGLQSLGRAGFEVVPWTANSLADIDALLGLGVRGLISDDPQVLVERVRAFDADGDGRAGDYLLPDGRIDPTRFDAEGHRGARARRPENSLPGFEFALDQGVTSLELDCALTRDGQLLLAHDVEVPSGSLRRLASKDPADARSIRSLSLAELRDDFRSDRLDPNFPQQANDLALAPVSMAFAQARNWETPFTPATLSDLLRFVEFYRRHYQTGDGALDAEAANRARTAAEVRFNIELKTSPEVERQTGDLSPWLEALDRALEAGPRALDRRQRLCLQSFDGRLLENAAGLPLAWLISPRTLDEQDGPRGEFQEAFHPNPWLGGAPMPRHTTPWSKAPRFDQIEAPVRNSGGFEGLTFDPLRERLLVLLEKPLWDDSARELLLFSVDPKGGSGPASVWRYPLSPSATAVGDLQWLGPDRLLVLERDDSQGDLNGWKRLFVARLGPAGGLLEKTELVDLLHLPVPDAWRDQVQLCTELAEGEQPGDVGLPSRTAIGADETFALPYITLESALPLADGRLLIVNDNNYPFSIGRHQGTHRPDDTEFLWLARPTGPPPGEQVPPSGEQ